MKNEEFATAMDRRIRKIARKMWMLAGAAFFILHSSFFISCSESDEENTNEYANWQARNDAFFASLEDSLMTAHLSSQASVASSWLHIKTYNKNEDIEGLPTDYIYAKVIERGSETDSPLFTDSVYVSLRGYLIPTASFPNGYVFTQTYSGPFSWQTAGVTKIAISTYSVKGVSTALQHMHRGDRWRVYVPYDLGYGQAGSGSSVPAYSTLIFDLALVDFAPVGTSLPRWSSRQW